MKGIVSVCLCVLVSGMSLSSQASYTLVSENLGGGHYSASGVDPNQPWQVAANAFDGSFDWPVWLAGAGAPQWIEVDLGQPRKLVKVALCPEQYPAGNTTQEIYFSDSPIGNDRTWSTLIHTFTGNSASGDIREYVLPSPVLARYVQVYCTQWQNNVALREVQLFVPERAMVGVDGEVNDGEYTTVRYDLCGSTNEGGYWVSETQVDSGLTSIADIYRWGCKVEDEVFYAFVELKNRNIRTLDGGQLGSPCSFFGFFIDTDNNPATGYAHTDFPNDNGFDVDLEVSNDYGYLGGLGTINFWYGASNFGIPAPAINATVNYYGNVLEISCPVADILSQTGVSAANGRFWRIAPRVEGNLTGSGTGDYEADVADAVVIESILLLAGDANFDNKVDVGDLGILAANYGGVNKTWAEGDFNKDGKVDVGDLGILAANYGTNVSGADFETDYAKVFGTAAIDEGSSEDEIASSICVGLGLPLVVGLVILGLMLVKLDAQEALYFALIHKRSLK